MKSVNTVHLLGHVGQNPVVKDISNIKLANFSLATSEKRKDKDEVTQWHNCVAFGKLADIVGQYIKKGSKLYVEGSIQYQEVEKDGVKTKYTKIIVNELSMISSPDSDSQPSTENKKMEGGNDSRKTLAILDDEIPF